MMDISKIVLNTKNTFLEVEEEPSKVEARSASLPRSWKVANAKEEEEEACNSDESTASLASFPAHAGRMLSDSLSDNDEELPSTRQPSLCSWDVLCPASPSLPSARRSPPSSMRGEEEEEEAPEEAAEEVVSARTRSPRRRGRGRRSRASFIEFSVTLDKRNGGSHGIDIDWSSGVHLLIEGVNTPGLVASWNEQHPQQAVNVGNCIVEVNSIRGKAAELLEEMKKNEILKIRVRSKRQPPAEEPASPTCKASTSSSPHRSPLRRTALSAQAPLFQPGAAAPCASAASSVWVAPEGMKAEFGEAVQAFNVALASCLPAGWWMEAKSSSVRISAVAPNPSSASFLAKSVQQMIQNIVAKFPSVFLLGQQGQAFQAIGQCGFRFELCSLPKDRFQRACWDHLGKGFCPRGSSCTWHHPQESELLEVQVMLNSVQQPVVCIPVMPRLGAVRGEGR